MRISMIAAMTRNRVIGRDNAMPWRLPADLKHFRQVTIGKPVLMGRKTYESIGRPLPGRLNVVVSRNDAYQPQGVMRAHSICEAFAQVIDHDEVMIAGGASFYSQMMPFANTLYLTLIDAELEGDSYFPEYRQQEWRESERRERPADSDNRYHLTFITLQRIIDPESYPVCEIEPD